MALSDLQPQIRAKIKGNELLVIGSILLIVMVVTGFVVWKLGKAYLGNLSQFNPTIQSQELSGTKIETVKKISVKNRTTNDCLEITPDGIVRVFTGCTDELSSASRLYDTKNINRLFQLLSGKNLENLNQKEEGDAYELTIQTSDGEKKITLWINDETGNDVLDVITTIVHITEDIPPVFSPAASSVSSSPSVNTSAVPNASSPPAASIAPSAIPGSSGVPFTCGFIGNQDKKPFNVSNIICSDEPQ